MLLALTINERASKVKRTFQLKREIHTEEKFKCAREDGKDYSCKFSDCRGKCGLHRERQNRDLAFEETSAY